MKEHECANLIADIAAFYPQIKDPVVLANSYFMLIGKFPEPVARSAFMTLIKDAGAINFPAPGKVYEQCRLLLRTAGVARGLPYRGQERAKIEAWLRQVCEDENYRSSDADQRTRALARHFFPDISAGSYEANFLAFDHIRQMYDDCMNCRGRCRRGGYTGFPRLDKQSDAVVVIMAKCGRECCWQQAV